MRLVVKGGDFMFGGLGKVEFLEISARELRA